MEVEEEVDQVDQVEEKQTSKFSNSVSKDLPSKEVIVSNTEDQTLLQQKTGIQKNSTKNFVCCSAPGKVLITGGYLILERPNRGLVLTLDARFYTTIQPIETENVEEKKEKNVGPYLISVESPQFHHKQQYQLILNSSDSPIGFELIPSNKDTYKPNPYTENSITFCLYTIQKMFEQENKSEKLAQFYNLLESGLNITIVGDNAFYSQREQLEKLKLPLSLGSLQQLPSFLISSNPVDKISKTGLGSSAALVTSLIASLLGYFRFCKLPKRRSSTHSYNLQILHNLSQFCHCLAQGKIGSGFDISSAVYGSQIYTRFSKEIIQPLLNLKDFNRTSFLNTINSPWDTIATKFFLPKGMYLLLGDVGSNGSNTPNMVSKVLQWKIDCPTSASFRWSHLSKNNTEVEREFNSLNEMSSFPSYINNLRKCGTLRADQWLNVNSEISDSLSRLRQSFLASRFHLKSMGKECQVEIEPDSQEQLCNETMNLPGVLIAGVPGAGGYDAIFAILIHKEAFKPVETLWTKHNILPLFIKEDNSGVCKEEISPQCHSCEEIK